MGVLDRFERGVENVVSAAFAKTFRAGVKPVELSGALKKQADAQAAVVDRDRTVAPNEYDIGLNEVDHAAILEWGEDALAREFEAALGDHAEFQRYAFVGPVVVRFFREQTLSTGRYTITSRTARGPAAPATTSTHQQSRYPLIDVDGKRYHLTGETTVLGRGTESDIVVDDTGISRMHIRFEVTQYGTILTDLASTNGTYVEDQKIKDVTLLDGNAITIGRTTIMYWDGVAASRDDDQ